MSKHAIDDNIQGDLWKKMKYGAATAVAVGSGIYAITSACPAGIPSLVEHANGFGDECSAGKR